MINGTEVRSKEITIRLTPDELAAVEAAARADGSPRAAWCHDVIVRALSENSGAVYETQRQILLELSALKEIATTSEDILKRCAGVWNPYWDLDLHQAAAHLERRGQLEAQEPEHLSLDELNELSQLRRDAIAGGLWEVWCHSGKAGLMAAKAGR